MTALPPQRNPQAQTEEPPPVLKTWRRLYLAVIAWLVFLIAVFYLFARVFSS